MARSQTQLAPVGAVHSRAAFFAGSALTLALSATVFVLSELVNTDQIVRLRAQLAEAS